MGVERGLVQEHSTTKPLVVRAGRVFRGHSGYCKVNDEFGPPIVN